VSASEQDAASPSEQPAGSPSDPPVRTAAFFDLDKTVIAKSSTLAFSKPFFDQGLLNRRAVLKSTYAQFFFMLSGADHDQMDRMRSYVTNMCTGWDVEQIKSIVNETLHDIVDPLVFAEAADLIADHKLCGRDVVVVSASGEEIVAPIARGLDATHAMATRMVVEDGRYTGEIAFYCYGEGKVDAITGFSFSSYINLVANGVPADDISVIARVAGHDPVIVTGCSHAGIINIGRHAMALTGASGIHGIIGGLHLLSADDECIEKTAKGLLEFNPAWVFAGHCTGFRAQAALYARFGSRFAPIHTGMHLTVDDLSPPSD
jgi:HAD superfamily hydrolase (TIGR01490 family)